MDINIRHRDGVVIVKPDGRIIGAAGGELRKAIDEQLANISGPPRFLFDLADVSMMDSSGLGTLVGLHVSAARKKGRIGVINVSSGINNLIVMGRLITVLEHFDSEDQAITELTKDRK